MKNLLVALLVVTSGAAFGYDGGYQYQANVDRRAQIDEARRILEGNGGYFVGPRELAAVAAVPVQGMPSEVPFTARELLDCARPCALVLTVSSFGDRRAPTAINELIRASEFRSRINLGDSKLTAWFLREPFADRRLRDGWILVSLQVRDKGLSYDRRFAPGRESPLEAVAAVWLAALLPAEVFGGQYFYTADSAGKDIVIVGRNPGGELIIDRRLRAIGDPQVGHLPGLVSAGGGVGAPPTTAPEKRRKDRLRVQ